MNLISSKFWLQLCSIKIYEGKDFTCSYVLCYKERRSKWVGMISNFLLYILQYLAITCLVYYIHVYIYIYIRRMSEKLDKLVMVKGFIVTKS